MACGVPVVCANNSCLPEVAGESAVQVMATDTVALAEALKRLATDFVLREQAIREGFRQAQKFNWQTAAERLLNVYQQFSTS